MSTNLLTPAELADLLGVPQRTLDMWRYHARGPAYVRVGRHVRYDPTAVDSWLSENTVKTPGGGDAA